MRSVVALLAAAGLGGLRAEPGRPAGHRRHALRSGARRHHGRRQLRAERGRSRRRPGQRPRTMVETGRRAQRDEFVVVSDGTGGPMQQARAQRVGQVLSNAGARWVEHVGRAGHGDGPRHRGRGALGIPAGLQQLPELQPGHHRQSQRGGDAGLRLRRRLQHGPDAGPPARCRGRPLGRPGRRHGQRARRSPRYREGKVPALNTTGMIGGSSARRRWQCRRRRWRRRRLVGLEQLRLRHVGFRNRAASAVRLPATKGPRSAPWPSCRTPSRCRACRPTCST